MRLGRDLGGRRPRRARVAEGGGVQRRRCRRTTRHRAWRSPGTSAAASSISARTGVMPRVPMISALVISAPSQWETSISSWPGHAREQVLVAAGEPDDLVREHRADDQRHVVLDDRAVDPDLDAVLEHAADSSAIRSAPMCPTLTNVSGSHHSWLRASDRLGADVAAERRVVHRGVGAERDEHGEPGDAAVQRARGPPTAAAAAGSCGSRRARSRRRCDRRAARRRADRGRSADLLVRRGPRRAHRSAPPEIAPGHLLISSRAPYRYGRRTAHGSPLHPDRLLPAEPGVRAIARELYGAVRDLPVISPHGHVDPRLLLADEPFPDPATLLVTPDHYVTRLLHASGRPARRARRRAAAPDRGAVAGDLAADVRALGRVPRHARPLLVRARAGGDLRHRRAARPPPRRTRSTTS